VRQALYERIRVHLRTFPRDKVDRFLKELIPTLVSAAVAPRSALGLPERLNKLKRTLASAKAFKESMRPPADNHEMLSDPNRAEQMRRIADAALSARGDLELTRTMVQEVLTGGDQPSLSMAWQSMMPHLNTFIAALEQEIARRAPKRTGRPSADPDGMLATVARTYAAVLEVEPTSTEGGPFYNVACEILLRKGIKDPQRWVLAAIRNYRPTKLQKSD
jgi:hypothetical protein